MPTAKQRSPQPPDLTTIEGALQLQDQSQPNDPPAPQTPNVTPARALYDADAQQIVPTIIHDEDGDPCEVLLQAAPLTDELLRAYVTARSKATTEFADSAEVNASAVKVAFDFFQKFIPTVAEVDGELPATWANEYGAPDRLVILSALLSCEPFEPIIKQSKIKKRKTWGEHTNTASRVRLRSLYDGDYIETDLYFHKVPADLFGDYLRIKDEADELTLLDKLASVTSGKPEDRSLYEKLFARADGYAGRVPIHHRLIGVRAHLENAVQVTRKK
jgi:hypothetical protein